ncbi:hypothetical protein STEG23_029835, partial [Scotinomys teguina]
VMTNLGCQLDYIWNQLKAKHLSTRLVLFSANTFVLYDMVMMMMMMMMMMMKTVMVVIMKMVMMMVMMTIVIMTIVDDDEDGDDGEEGDDDGDNDEESIPGVHTRRLFGDEVSLTVSFGEDRGITPSKVDILSLYFFQITVNRGLQSDVRFTKQQERSLGHGLKIPRQHDDAERKKRKNQKCYVTHQLSDIRRSEDVSGGYVNPGFQSVGLSLQLYACTSVSLV